MKSNTIGKLIKPLFKPKDHLKFKNIASLDD